MTLNNNVRILILISFVIVGFFVILCGLIVNSILLFLLGCVILSILLAPFICSIIESEKIIQNFTNQEIINDSYPRSYHSIIIANSTKQDKRVGILVGIDLLVKRFTSQKCKYKITVCDTPLEVKNEIENPHADYIYLFGHGFKGGLTFYNADESISKFEYSSVNPTFSKKFIGQFHCNQGNGLSLVELLLKKPDVDNHYFIPGYTLNFLLWFDIRFKVIHKIKKC